MYPKGGLICSEHINPRSSTERRSTASERECLTETDVRFLLAEEQKAERDFLTNLREFLTNLKVRTTIEWSFFLSASLQYLHLTETGG